MNQEQARREGQADQGAASPEGAPSLLPIAPSLHSAPPASLALARMRNFLLGLSRPAAVWAAAAAVSGFMGVPATAPARRATARSPSAPPPPREVAEGSAGSEGTGRCREGYGGSGSVASLPCGSRGVCRFGGRRVGHEASTERLPRQSGAALAPPRADQPRAHRCVHRSDCRVWIGPRIRRRCRGPSRHSFVVGPGGKMWWEASAGPARGGGYRPGSGRGAAIGSAATWARAVQDSLFGRLA